MKFKIRHHSHVWLFEMPPFIIMSILIMIMTLCTIIILSSTSWPFTSWSWSLPLLSTSWSLLSILLLLSTSWLSLSISGARNRGAWLVLDNRDFPRCLKRVCFGDFEFWNYNNKNLLITLQPSLIQSSFLLIFPLFSFWLLVKIVSFWLLVIIFTLLTTKMWKIKVLNFQLSNDF